MSFTVSLLQSTMNTTTCIPIEKKCNGVLDFIPSSSTWKISENFNTDDYYLRNGALMMMSDELFCAERYISVYISILVCLFNK